MLRRWLQAVLIVALTVQFGGTVRYAHLALDHEDHGTPASHEHHGDCRFCQVLTAFTAVTPEYPVPVFPAITPTRSVSREKRFIPLTSSITIPLPRSPPLPAG